MDEQKKQKYLEAPVSIQYLYASPEAGAELYEVSKKYQLPEQKYLTYAKVIGDVILGLYTTAQLPKLLETELGIDEAKALAIVEDLREFLKPVYDRENGTLPDEPEPAPSYEEQVFREAAPASNLSKAAPDWDFSRATDTAPAEASQVQSSVANPSITKTPTTTEESTRTEPDSLTIAPMRTMEGDMQKVHGYGAYREQFPAANQGRERIVQSSQDEALTRSRPSLASTPKVED